jgi:hypothetical protein
VETPRQRADRVVYGAEKETALYEALRCPACNDEDLERIRDELEEEFTKAAAQIPIAVRTSTNPPNATYDVQTVQVLKIVNLAELAETLRVVGQLMKEGKL